MERFRSYNHVFQWSCVHCKTKSKILDILTDNITCCDAPSVDSFYNYFDERIYDTASKYLGADLTDESNLYVIQYWLYKHMGAKHFIYRVVLHFLAMIEDPEDAARLKAQTPGNWENIPDPPRPEGWVQQALENGFTPEHDQETEDCDSTSTSASDSSDEPPPGPRTIRKPHPLKRKFHITARNDEDEEDSSDEDNLSSHGNDDNSTHGTGVACQEDSHEDGNQPPEADKLSNGGDNGVHKGGHASSRGPRDYQHGDHGSLPEGHGSRKGDQFLSHGAQSPHSQLDKSPPKISNPSYQNTIPSHKGDKSLPFQTSSSLPSDHRSLKEHTNHRKDNMPIDYDEHGEEVKYKPSEESKPTKPTHTSPGDGKALLKGNMSQEDPKNSSADDGKPPHQAITTSQDGQTTSRGGNTLPFPTFPIPAYDSSAETSDQPPTSCQYGGEPGPPNGLRPDLSLPPRPPPGIGWHGRAPAFAPTPAPAPAFAPTPAPTPPPVQMPQYRNPSTWLPSQQQPFGFHHFGGAFGAPGPLPNYQQGPPGGYGWVPPPPHTYRPPPPHTFRPPPPHTLRPPHPPTFQPPPPSYPPPPPPPPPPQQGYVPQYNVPGQAPGLAQAFQAAPPPPPPSAAPPPPPPPPASHGPHQRRRAPYMGPRPAKRERMAARRRSASPGGGDGGPGSYRSRE